MVDPLLALGVFAALAATTAVLLWPEKGLVARVRRRLGVTERVLLEDALKHLHACERRDRSPTVEGLAGAVGVSVGHAADLLSRLVASDLATTSRGELSLTAEGRRAARHVVRSHRLWEQWLADRTGVRPDDWHDQAELVEHTLTPEEADRLSARLGHPRYDPHGDPIPTSAGELPPPAGRPLTAVPEGSHVRVVHVEDEPTELFRSLRKQGMSPGVEADVISAGERGFVLQTDRGQHRLDPVAAGQLTVELLSGGAGPEVPRETRETLDEVPRGQTVRVASIAPSCQGQQRRRLLDLGLVRGTEVTPELVSTAGDPVAYRIRGALIGLRRSQAHHVLVEPVQGDGTEAAESPGPGSGPGTTGRRVG